MLSWGQVGNFGLETRHRQPFGHGNKASTRVSRARGGSFIPGPSLRKADTFPGSGPTTKSSSLREREAINMSCPVFVPFHSAIKMLQLTPDMSFSSAEGVNKGN